MDRARKIIALCLAAVFLVTLTVWAAGRNSLSYSFTATRGRADFWIGGSSKYADYYRKASLKNSKNKVLMTWKQKKSFKQYKKKNGGYLFYYPYTFNMGSLPSGTYYLTSYETNKYGNWAMAPVTKVFRNNRGDLMQRFTFNRFTPKATTFHAQIFNSKNQMVRSFKLNCARSSQMYSFNWNGWPGKTSVNRCPRGVYTVKYWIDGMSPRTAKFRLAI